MIGVMEPVSGEENGHPSGVKNGRISQRRQDPIAGGCNLGVASGGPFELHAIGVVAQPINSG
jgi:hypothetical protein